MPIKPENKALYPANWAEIRADILKLAKNRCEFCSVENHLIGWRDAEGDFHADPGNGREGCKYIKIVLTIAHLDHDPTNNDRENLRALCQRCHLRHDKAHHAAQRVKNRFAKESARGQGDALGGLWLGK